MTRRLTVCLLALLAAGFFVAACRQYLPSNRWLQKRASPAAPTTADARNKFDHARHTAALAKTQVTCVDCHRFDALVDSGTEPLARELSAHAQYPGSGACHFCHGPGETRNPAAPDTCTSCHQNLAALRPADHDVAWERVHGRAAQVNSAPCETCHRQAECIDCHERRDTIQMRMHDRNFRSFHGIEATANPMRCSSCHREDFCIRCHERGQS